MERKFSELKLWEKGLSIFCTVVAFVYWLITMLLFIAFIPLFGIIAIVYVVGNTIIDFFEMAGRFVVKYSFFR